MYLAVVAFLPYPTRLPGQYGDQPIAVVVYAVTVILIMLLAGLKRIHSQQARLFAPDAPKEPRGRYLVVPAVFLVSIPVALLASAAAAEWDMDGARRPPSSDAREPEHPLDKRTVAIYR